MMTTVPPPPSGRCWRSTCRGARAPCACARPALMELRAAVLEFLYEKQAPQAPEGRVRVVVIGNGMVGQRFLEKLASRGADFELTAFCEEPRPAYDRVQLTTFFSGKTADDLSLAREVLPGQQGHAAAERRGPGDRSAEEARALGALPRRCRTTSWSSPRARIPSCRPSRERTGVTASSIAPSRTWR